ncbi:hypothetical protein GCM10007989_21410 [Devosia pacifica]|uniref:EamA domain-containing protein n=1 Tax=Devosia pacifica TaxID=1335967 RepID=A0A918S7V8_9HYPH|nr:EamA family transporter [Devosia pacifica]GHA25458.1 hypothetical protein GCM10007989_21410 [Devosia pacifica]
MQNFKTVAVPVLLVTLGMIATQTGSSFAKMLFPLVGTMGTVTMRLVLAAIVMLMVFRPWRRWPKPGQRRVILVYGLAMGAMNMLFYQAISTIPLGVAVALEFLGPLAVALAGSRRPIDYFWIILAVFGLWVLLPLGDAAAGLDPAGVGFALAAGICWAGYILFGQRAGGGGGAEIAALGISTAACLALPFGVATAGASMLDPVLLPAALGVALLSSAIPYSLDMLALPRLPARTFGILMSGQPALAALSGLLILGEALAIWQVIGIAAIVIASLGSTATVGPAPARSSDVAD